MEWKKVIEISDNNLNTWTRTERREERKTVKFRAGALSPEDSYFFQRWNLLIFKIEFELSSKFVEVYVWSIWNVEMKSADRTLSRPKRKCNVGRNRIKCLIFRYWHYIQIKKLSHGWRSTSKIVTWLNTIKFLQLKIKLQKISDGLWKNIFELVLKRFLI